MLKNGTFLIFGQKQKSTDF
nr:hypothetical protein [Sicyoidochytrium minutum DNA virus]